MKSMTIVEWLSYGFIALCRFMWRALVFEVDWLKGQFNKIKGVSVTDDDGVSVTIVMFSYVISFVAQMIFALYLIISLDHTLRGPDVTWWQAFVLAKLISFCFSFCAFTSFLIKRDELSK